MTTAATARWSDRIFGLLGLRIWIWLFVAAKYLAGVLVEPRNVAEYHDEHYSYMYEDVARRTLLEFKQIPAWNPWYCVGVHGIANPQGTTLSPDFVLRIFFGVGIGRRLAILLFIVLAMEGVYRLARKHDCSPIGATFAGVAWGVLGWFSHMYTSGWLNQVGFQLIPWIVLSYENGIQNRKWSVLGGFFVAWSLVAGGTYPVPHGGLILALLCFFETARLWRQEERWGPLLSLVTLYGTALLFCAVKSIPMALVLAKYPRIWIPSEGHEPVNMLLAMAKNPGLEYAGPWIFVLGLASLAFADRKSARFMLLAGFFFVLSCGDIGKYSPYLFLRKFPVYSQLRSPERFSIDTALFLALASARFLTRVEDGVETIVRRIVGLRAVGGILAGVVIAWMVTKPTLDVVEETAMHPGVYNMQPPLAMAGPFKQSRGNRWDAHVWTPLNTGSLQCFEEIPFPQSTRLRGDLPAEEYPADPAVASVERLEWTPEAIRLHVFASQATTVFVNQNWAPAWTSSVGKVRSEEGMIAIDVPQGDHTLTLRYRDWMVYLGLGITLLSLGVAGYFVVRLGIERGRSWRDRWRKMPFSTLGLLPTSATKALASSVPDEEADHSQPSKPADEKPEGE